MAAKRIGRFYIHRPDKKILAKMFAELEKGEKNMREILLSPATPSRETFYAWLNGDPEIRAQYDASLKIAAEVNEGFSSVRPDPEIIHEICTLLVNPDANLKQILSMEGMPEPTTFYRWIQDNDAYFDMYWKARQMQAMAFSDMMWSIAKDSSHDYENGKFQKDHVQRDRLKIDTLKFICAKLLVKLFGDNKNVSVEVNHLHSIPDDALDQQILILQKRVEKAIPGDTAKLIGGSGAGSG